MKPSHSFSGQRAKILALLTDAKGGEVPLPAIKALAAQYNSRLLELRRAGFRIPRPRMQIINGQRHTWYRLESTPAPSQTQQKPIAPESLFPDDAPPRHLDLG